MERIPNERRRAKTEAHISLGNLARNYRAVRALIGEEKRICCVVKADAYGHGAWECVRRLAAEGADFFAVSSVGEAEEVRLALSEYGDKIGILILGYTLPSDTDLLIRYHISQNVFSESYAQQLAEALRGYRRTGAVPPEEKLSVHIKIDTGMNRLGFRPDAADEILRVCKMPEFSPDGIFSHFAEADEPASPATARQYGRFLSCLDALKERGQTFPLRHISNSAAITNFPETQLDMVRYGIELYGLMPSAHTLPPPAGLHPVMTLETVVSHIHTVHAGEAVGYGGTYVPGHDIRLATLPVGYADGFVRAYGGAEAVICGKRAPIRGRICMDQCMVDVTDIPEAEEGCLAVLFGENAPSADEIAARAGTIGYEVVCIVGKRVPRVYSE